MTSAMKPLVSLSLMRPPGAVPGAPLPAFAPPISVSMLSTFLRLPPLRWARALLRASHRGRLTAEIQHLRAVAAGFDEFQQVAGRDRRGLVVDQGMDIDRIMGQERLVDHHPDLGLAIIDKAQR